MDGKGGAEMVWQILLQQLPIDLHRWYMCCAINQMRDGDAFAEGEKWDCVVAFIRAESFP